MKKLIIAVVVGTVVGGVVVVLKALEAFPLSVRRTK